MSVNLSIKDVPDALAERLRQRAARNHRSLQGELMAIVEQAALAESAAAAPTTIDSPSTAPQAGTAPPVRRQSMGKSIEQIAEEARQRFPGGTPSSVDLIRQMRDSRLNGDPTAHGNP